MTSPEKTSWAVILAIWLGGLGAAAQYGKVSVIFDSMGDLYPQAGPSLGFAVSLVGLLGILLGVVAGMYVSALGYRRVLVWSLCIGAVMSAIQTLHLPFGLFLGTRVVEGISHLGIVVTSPTLIAQVSTDRTRGFAMSLWSTFFGVAFALLAVFGRPIVEQSGPLALFGVHSGLMVCLAGTVYLALRRVPPLPRRAPPALISLPALHRSLYRSPFISAPAVGWLFYTCCFVSVLTVLPPYIDADVRVWVMGAMPLISIAASMTLGVRILAYVPAVRLVQVGFFGAVLSVLWLWISPGDPTACLALAAAMGLVQSGSFAAVPQLNTTAQTRAEASGAMAQTGNLGNTIGTPIMVWVLIISGYNGLMAVLALILSGGLIAHLALGRSRTAARTGSGSLAGPDASG